MEQSLLSPKQYGDGLKSVEKNRSDGQTMKVNSGGRRSRLVRFRSTSDVYVARVFDDCAEARPVRKPGDLIGPDYLVSLKGCPEAKVVSPVGSTKMLPRFSRIYAMITIVLALLALAQALPILGFGTLLEPDVLGNEALQLSSINRRAAVKRRQASTPNYCTQWSMQTAVVNGTLYSFGGRVTQSGGQTEGTWTNDFVTLDLTKNWSTAAPALENITASSGGPPAVANGYLWHSYSSLFVYGGEYSDTPVVSPVPYALWEYDIASKSWVEHGNPQTTAGNNSAGGGQPVQEAAEGAGITVPSLGRGYYFGGHQDFLTTAGWSIQTTRIYLKSMIEFTFPGYTNNGVQGISTTPAGPTGAWRNITEGGLQNTDGFTERADGVLVYIPGYGEQGILLGLAGGTNTTFTEMNVIDVYDIATSTWYKQSTQGGPPPIRVNPCAIAVAAADGSSTNVYMYGGQNLQPYKQQTQYGDMWILSVPSFAWIQVNDSDGAPPSRAGHACEIWDAQMIVYGGYVGTQITCDDPGIYVFDASKLTWETSFNALSGGDDQSQQASQSKNDLGLPGSYGYQVPALVQSVIGGNGNGGATVTAPVVGATAGPLATGSPIIYTATVSGQVITETAGSSSGSSTSGSTGSSTSSASGTNVAAIAAGVVAGVLFLVACYLAFAAYLYRRQLQIYKAHVAAAQRASSGPPAHHQQQRVALLAGEHREKLSSENPSSLGRGPSTAKNSSSNDATDPSLERRYSSASSSRLQYHEPSFFGVLMRPRRSLRIVNRD